MSGSVQVDAVRGRISEFIVSNFLFGDQEAAPEADQSLLSTGIVDSTGILELIEFLESEFAIVVGEDETTPDNLDSVSRLSAYVALKTGESVLSAAS